MNRRKSALAVMLTIVAAAPAVAEQAYFTPLPTTEIVEGQVSAKNLTSLADIGSLTVDSDFTVFMRNDVPEDVRRIALRKLWILMELSQSCMELCVEPEPNFAARLIASAGK